MEEERITTFQEDTEGYEQSITFDEEKFNILEKLQLDLENPENLFSKCSQIFKRKNVVVTHVQEYEIPIDTDQSSGDVNLSIITKDAIKTILNKVSREKRNKIQYIHFAGIQILIKALFKRGIDTPLIIGLYDKRIRNPQEAELGFIEGNLYYKTIMFNCYPRYSISLKDEKLDDSLTLYFKLLRDDFMNKGSKPFTIHCRALFSFTNSNHSELYHKKPFIEANEKCEDICKTLRPDIGRAKLPEKYSLEFEGNRRMSFDGREKEKIVRQPSLRYDGNKIMSKKYAESSSVITRYQPNIKRTIGTFKIKI